MMLDRFKGDKTNRLGIQKGSLFFIGGPCVIESEDLVFEVAGALKEITTHLGIPYIFKASYDKANRSSGHSFRGPGIEKGLAILDKVKTQLNIPVLSDVHGVEELDAVKDVLDIIQIPAFLCRQTDLVQKAVEIGAIVNIKKGQFLAPWDMKYVLDKAVDAGSEDILLTERGVSFGYNNLVSDMRAIPIMREWGYPVVFDATHSVQLPGGLGSCSSGQREFALHLANAACAVGADGLFFEVHPDPDQGLSDGPNMVALKDIEAILKQTQAMKQCFEGIS